jgi:choline dehydrogenase
MVYDYIIVGAGSAGSTLAARLSEDAGVSVLLLESGPDYPSFAETPDDLKYDNHQAASRPDSPHNWNFKGQATDLQSNETPVARGKVVGGTSSINHQIFLRAIPEDFDIWESLGNPGWSYTDVLPYFRKAESDADLNGDFHGDTGPIPVWRHPQNTWVPLQAAFYETCVSSGFPVDHDMNHPEASGVGAIPLNNPNGIRMSTALTYLPPARHRLNLTIKPNTHVKELVFNGSRVTGLRAVSGEEIFLLEGNEIILSAGAISTPHLLMLSGVGSKTQLEMAGIVPVVDLPGVGKNLKNHPSASIRYNPAADNPIRLSDPRNQVGLRLTISGSPYRNEIQIQPTASYSAELDVPDIRVGVRLEYPLSVGEISILSPDPTMQPRIAFNFLSDAEDRRRLREAVRMCVELFAKKPLCDNIGTRQSPGDNIIASDAEMDVWLKRTVTIAGHSSCSCKMGPQSDPMAVVDASGRVYGVDGLRVVDASIMPDIVRANTNATTIMMAEKMSDTIMNQSVR